ALCGCTNASAADKQMTDWLLSGARAFRRTAYGLLVMTHGPGIATGRGAGLPPHALRDLGDGPRPGSAARAGRRAALVSRRSDSGGRRHARGCQAGVRFHDQRGTVGDAAAGVARRGAGPGV